MTGIKVKGIDQAIKSLRKFQKELNDELLQGSYEAARVVALEIRNLAPKGETGNLRRAIQYGRLKWRIGKNVAGYVRVSHRIAPHAHLVEFGTAMRRHKSGKETGVAIPRPYFRPVVDRVALGTFKPVTKSAQRALAKFKP